jgi:putative hydroxymethylpyrimidine transport system permease protein
MNSLRRLLRPLVTACGLVLAWWVFVRVTAVPAYMLPGPGAVAQALVDQRNLLFWSALVTFGEARAGLLIGTVLGAAFGLLIVFSPPMQRWLMPLLLVSQAVPVFALAPVLVLWFGFGMASKIIVAVVVIFFPVTAAFADGMRRTDRGMLDLATTMNAPKLAVLRHVRVPAALPAFGSGLRVATAAAPVGAVFGEWVGSSAGLGYVMLNANARIETDLMFAAVFVLSVFAVLLWVAVDRLLRRLLFWVPDTTGAL